MFSQNHRFYPFGSRLWPEISGLTLCLLVLGVLADHPNPTFAPDDLALLTHPFDGRTNLHCDSLLTSVRMATRPVPYLRR